MSPQGKKMPAFCHPWEFFAKFYCCCIFVPKERYPECMFELNLGLCNVVESSIFSSTHITHLTVIIQSMKYALIFCAT